MYNDAMAKSVRTETAINDGDNTERNDRNIYARIYGTYEIITHHPTATLRIT